MSTLYHRLLRQRISSLTAEFARLEVERDEAIRSRHSATAPEQKRQSIERIVRAMGALRQVEKRLHHAKRLLAHAQGDDYVFRVV